jgi:HNH endonuclease
VDFSNLLSGIDYIVDGNECHIWQHHVGKNGYGQSQDSISGKVRGAYVLAWEQLNGLVPEGFEVCHTRDVRSCINILHLFLGTRAENLQDMRDKGRHSYPPVLFGEEHPKHKLSDEDVRKIKSEYSGERGQKAELARKYNVSKTQIGYILSGKQRKSN